MKMRRGRRECPHGCGYEFSVSQISNECNADEDAESNCPNCKGEVLFGVRVTVHYYVKPPQRPQRLKVLRNELEQRDK